MLQSEFMSCLNSRVKTDLRVINPNFTDEELYEMKEDPEAALKLTMSNVLGPAHPRLKSTVQAIQDKFEAILLLERSVNELFELAQDLATLVKAQGEQLDSVEENLKATETYVEQAQMKMENAEDISKGN